MKNKKILPPTYFILSIIFVPVFHFVIPVLRIIPFPWNLTGLFPIAAGGILNLAADKYFKLLNTTVKPFEYSSVLITAGVFRFSRNPMYSGMAFIILGEAVLFGSVSPFMFVIIFMLLMNNIFIKTEESMLLEKFSEEYADYLKKVRRWI